MDMQQATRLVLRQFMQNGETEDIEQLKKTMEKAQQQDPTAGGEWIIENLNKALKERKQEG